MSLGSDLTGMRFGFLRVMGRAANKNRKAMWFCECDCGEKTIARGERLLNGRSKACNINGHRAGGEKPHAWRLKEIEEYRVWCSMRERCRCPSHRNWHNYGGRGIRVCSRWEVSFQTFLADMGPRPSSVHSIERIDTNGHYEPDNCRWATTREQNRNKRNNRYVEWRGVRRLLVDVARQNNLDPSVLAGRLKMGWPLDRAIYQPIRPRRKNQVALEVA